MQGNLTTTDRKLIVDQLQKRKWFKNTKLEIQEKLKNLPDDFDGYLADLSQRKDEIGSLDVLELEKVETGNFTAISVFKVRSKQSNGVFTYEYVSGKYGSNPGYRGILLLETNGKITHFIVKKTEKFAFGGEQTYDSIGGFILYQRGQLLNMPLKVESEIKRQLGIKELQIKRFIDLGLMTPDSGMVNTRVSLFSAVIDASKSKEIARLNQKTISNTKKISFDLMILPIERINEYIHKVEDSYFLASIARLASIGVLEIKP